jgi:stage II sporulation protein R
MKYRNRNRLYAVELALLLSLTAALLLGVRVGAEHKALSDKLVRLHVIARSDSPVDQAVKLKVRDAVLARVEPALSGVDNAGDAAAVLRNLLPELENTARWVSGEEQVRVVLGREDYPTRHSEDFSLPAGEYTSLRVELGAAEGKNWWCVVYPPLCTGSVTEAVRETAAWEESDVQLITENGSGYVIRFRLLELWGQLTA